MTIGRMRQTKTSNTISILLETERRINGRHEDSENENKTNNNSGYQRSNSKITPIRFLSNDDEENKDTRSEYKRLDSTPIIEDSNGVKCIFATGELENDNFDEDLDTSNKEDKTKSKKRRCKMCRNKLRRKSVIPKLIILPNDVPKQFWDQLITLSVIFVTLVVPYRVAFIDEPDTNEWKWLLFSIDMIFLVDVVLTFFTAYLNEDKEYVMNHWAIFKNYIFGWFILDFISCIPINMMIETDNYNSLARFSRIPRIYKVLKVIRLTRMMKIAKEKSKWSQYLNEVLSIIN